MLRVQGSSSAVVRVVPTSDPLPVGSSRSRDIRDAYGVNIKWIAEVQLKDLKDSIWDPETREAYRETCSFSSDLCSLPL